MDKILTIIIPTYNMSEYLDTCLKSLIIESNLLEVLIINDGSKDNSLDIAKKYEKKYPHIFRTIDKPNGNYGSCVNRGLKEATGKYVKVLDADDKFNTESLTNLIDIASKTVVDAFITDFSKFHINGREDNVTFNLPSNKPLQFTDYCCHKDIINLWMHAIAYKRENLQAINYKQTEGISYTDQEWIFMPLTTIRTFMYIPGVLYIYTLGREGQTMSNTFSAKHFKDNLICTSHILDSYATLTNVNSAIKDMLVEKLFKRIRYIYKFYLLKCQQPDYTILTELDKKLKITCPEVYERSNHIIMSSPLLLYKYIKHWRSNPNGKLLQFMIKLYKGKKSLK